MSRLCELGALGGPGGLGSTALVDPSQAGVTPALSFSIAGPLGRLARSEFEDFIVNWSGIPIPQAIDTSQMEGLIEDPNIADLFPAEKNPEAAANLKLGTVLGQFSFLAPGAGVDGLLSETRSVWWLSPSRSAGRPDVPFERSGFLTEGISHEIARYILSSDAILVLVSAANPPLPPAVEGIAHAFSKATYIADGALDSQQYSIPTFSKPSRIVFGIADCGVPVSAKGYEGALESLSAADLYEAAILPTLGAIGKLFGEVQRLKMRAKTDFETQVLAVPFDFFGDLAELEMMNRDPAEPSTMRLRKRDFLPARRAYEPGTIWQTFNLVDPYVIALTGALSRMSFELP